MPLTVLSTREKVSANRTYYVRTDGADINTGLADTAAGAFLTIQKAIDVASGTLDIASGIIVTIQVRAGTYAAIDLKPKVGPGTIALIGDTSTPSNVVISSSSTNAITAGNYGSVSGYSISGFQVTTTGGGGWGVLVTTLSAITIAGNMDFAACVSGHIFVLGNSYVNSASGYTISGATVYHWRVGDGGRILCQSVTITLIATPAISVFALASRVSSMAVAGLTFSGSATGTRYSATEDSVISTGSGANATYLPGTVAGSVATGGQYT